MDLKFRAKVEGRIVYSNGFLLINKSTVVIVSCDKDGAITAPIDEGTLCQFTGVKDKNKNDIYNTDILTDGEITYTVNYNIQNSGFWLTPNEVVTEGVKEGVKESILLFMSETLGNGYYSRKDLELIKPISVRKINKL